MPGYPKGRTGSSNAVPVPRANLDPIDHVKNAVYVDGLKKASEAAGWVARPPPSCPTTRLEDLASAESGDGVVVDLQTPEGRGRVIAARTGAAHRPPHGTSKAQTSAID